MYDTISLVVGSGLTGVVPPGPGEGLIRAWGLGEREGSIPDIIPALQNTENTPRKAPIRSAFRHSY